MFQFQHGAIKIYNRDTVHVFRRAFQFQHGAIKILPDLNNANEMPMFQFQHGAIKMKSTTSATMYCF